MAASATLSDAARRRYARHVLLPEVGVAGQQTLLAASVRVLGDGPAAEEAATYLAAAGVGGVVVAASLHARLAERVAASNPDVRLAVDDGAHGLVTAAPLDGARRAAGAEAALCALLRVLGLGTGRDHLEGFR